MGLTAEAEAAMAESMRIQSEREYNEHLIEKTIHKVMSEYAKEGKFISETEAETIARLLSKLK